MSVGVGVNRVLSMPDPERLCVVAQGAGYVVHASQPAHWEKIDATPITDVRAVPGTSVIVFADYTELLAYADRGFRWRTKRLALSGELRMIASTGHILVGEYWDMRTDAMQRFEVDLATGATRGGVED